jgi:dTDP-4-amino-4,6-dideoxygalactose transaminase
VIVLPRMRPDLSAFEIATLLEPGRAEPGALEAAFCNQFGYRHAVWFPYARLGIQCWLESLDDRPRRVVAQAFVCSVVGDAIARAGLPAALVDVEEATHQQHPAQFSEALREQGSVGVTVRTWGGSHNGADAGASPVLYDLAMAALDPGRVVALKPEDAVIYSFGKGKPISVLHGGLLCGDNDANAAKWRNFRAGKLRPPHRLRQAAYAAIQGVAFEPHVFAVLLALREAIRSRGGTPRRSTDPSAPGDEWELLGRGGLEIASRRLSAIAQLRAERARQIQAYADGLGDLPALRTLRAEPFLSHFPLRLPRAERDRLKRFLLERRIYSSTELYDTTLVDHPTLRAELASELRTTHALRTELLQLPLFTWLTARDQDRVIEAVRAFYERS